MKYTTLVIIYLIIYSVAYSQEQENIIAALEQQTEIASENGGSDIQDDSFILQLERLKKHPLNLNKANADELKELITLSDLQIENLLNYRRLFGELLSIYELQAIPTWNIHLIKTLLPFITIEKNTNLADNIKERWNDGTNTILIRASRVLEKSLGYYKQPDSGSYFMGSANRLMIRYNYNYQNLLQWGFSGDKDAGEQFFKGKQRLGFDFYSFHFFLSRLGIIKALAVGDFTVNMGQGLIQWQSLAFSKSPEIASVKRQSSVLHPHTATGEFNFHRGAGITLQKGNWQTTFFLSLLKLSSNIVKDSLSDAGHITSINSSGYHRTPGEQEDRNNLQQITAGTVIKFITDKWHLAFNAIQYKFSLPIKKDDKPYNLYAARGDNFRNESIDYSYTYKNIHLFGEMAVDKSYHPAIVNGMLASLSPSVDLSLVYRSIDRSYQSFNANAFTENADPINEKGLYTGLNIRPSERLALSAYADYYHFPWLKYRVDAPSFGREYFIRLSYNPNKQVELYTHFRSEWKQQNISGSPAIISGPGIITKQNWRIHSSAVISKFLSFRSRAEMVFYNKNQANEEQGFLMFMDGLFKSHPNSWSGNLRLEYFETNGYNSRIYAFENDLLYNFSVPAVFDKGYRYYINLNYDISKFTKRFISQNVTGECWLKLSQTLYNEKLRIGTGVDEIDNNKKTELKIQIMIFL